MQLLPATSLLKLPIHRGLWEHFISFFPAEKCRGLVKWRPKKEVKCFPPARAKASGERKYV